MKRIRNVDLVRSLRFRYHRLAGSISVARSAICTTGRIDVIGRPIIEASPNSIISVGDEVCLISVGFATALGVNHPVVLRTLRPGAKIRIGSRVGISGGSICAAQCIEIGDDTILGANVTIADTDFHSLDPHHRRDHFHPSIGIEEVVIGKRVFIGTNSIVLKGVKIGDNAVIGAGSIVTKDVPANTIAGGSPCRVIRQLVPKGDVL